MPKYPVYVPSKGRYEHNLTARFLLKDGVDFKLVVEPQEADQYSKHYGAEHVLVLPFSNLGQGSIPARNWIKQHAIEQGAARHWQVDDNIQNIKRRYNGKRIPVNSGIALKVAEDFTDRYTNIAVSGLNYEVFLPNGSKFPPFFLNCHVYSCALIDNSIPYPWRGRYNEDTDLCLQALAGGYCTVLINAYLIDKATTMTMKGGNTDQLYKGDGRLHMAKALERMWPGVVETKRRFHRPQHVVKDAWRKFDTPLIRRTDIDWSQFEQVDEMGMELKQIKPIKSDEVKKMVRKYRKDNDK